MSVEHVAPTILLPCEEKRNFVSYINSNERRLVMSYLNDEKYIKLTDEFYLLSSNTPTDEHTRLVRFKLVNWTGTQQATFDILVV